MERFEYFLQTILNQWSCSCQHSTACSHIIATGCTYAALLIYVFLLRTEEREYLHCLKPRESEKTSGDEGEGRGEEEGGEGVQVGQDEVGQQRQPHRVQHLHHEDQHKAETRYHDLLHLLSLGVT